MTGIWRGGSDVPTAMNRYCGASVWCPVDDETTWRLGGLEALDPDKLAVVLDLLTVGLPFELAVFDALDRVLRDIAARARARGTHRPYTVYHSTTLHVPVGPPRSSSFRGAVKGVVIQQVKVLPEELMVHLGSYGAGAVGNCHG